MTDMFWFIKSLKGNPKTILMMEAPWTLPFNMFLPFATLYMFAIGLNDVEIGTLLSIGMFANFIMATLGGAITDKFGRRKTFLIFDCLAWCVPVLIWAFSQNFWWFLAAVLFNSVQHIALIAFECSWLDDLEEQKIPRLVNWFHIFWLSSVFSALVTGYFVSRYSVVPVLRIVYLVAFVSMTVRIVALVFLLKETERGKKRMEDTKDKSIAELLSGYKEVAVQVVRSRSMVRVLILMPMVSIFVMITQTFFALYATQDLQISEYFLAYFPVIRAGVALLFFFFIQDRLGTFDPKHLMTAGLILYLAGHTLLLTAPPQNIPWLLAYAFADAWAAALFLPRMDALLFGSIDPTERARCRSFINVVVLAITSPFGFLAGFLSDMDRRLPFALNVMLFICMIYFVLLRRPKTQKNTAAQQNQ